ncbi:DUF3822 family protein [uncultured Duncaniella sp.]|uniref:DUF3822 family protein n=1 Tax=uncultured Duncaniella sp. TaxID=2768039 RepID=UPI0026006BE4|nr:DUF3822 family protein [uncultured Duncaniella sp.]
MTPEALSERIESPEIRNLLLRLSHDALDVVIYSIVEDNSLIYRRFALDTASTSWIGAIQNVIYDHPALLSDFRRVYCVVETRDYTVVPAQCESEEQRRLLFDTAYPDSKLEMTADDTGTVNALVLTGIEPELRGFINRTFQRVTVVSHIAALCRYAAINGTHGNKVKMIANIRQDSIDVVITDGRRLLMANTFSYHNPEDAVYYLLAIRQRLGLDERNDELLLAGDQELRDRLTPMLRNFVARVVPIIFPPQMFKAGKDAMLAPFELITLPLCE